jgi:hypothetical protein
LNRGTTRFAPQRLALLDKLDAALQKSGSRHKRGSH